MSDTTRTYRIGISCIGSGVGQSTISSLRRSRLPFHTTGFGTNAFAYGMYECDAYDYTKSIYDEGYIDDLIAACLRNRIDLLLPGHDDEVLLYARHTDQFQQAGINAMHPGLEIVELCRDKERMSRELNPIADVFVKSFSPEEVDEALSSDALSYPFIAKPRGGYASRGIEIILGPEDLVRIDASHIIQELAVPASDDPNHKFYMNQLARRQNPQVAEWSIQLVFGYNGNLMGRMCTYNKLNQGIPIEIVPVENEEVWKITDQLTPALLSAGLRGPINLQGRMTDKGLKLFEMNPRFTGITGLRSMMGFNEVEACVKEWLGIDRGKNTLTFNQDRFGIRQTADKVISFSHNAEAAELRNRINAGAPDGVRTVVLTGANGYLGLQLARRIAEHTSSFRLITLTRNPEQTSQLLKDIEATHMSWSDLEDGRLNLSIADVLVHAAFARPHCTPAQLADSVQLTGNLFARAAQGQVPFILNISSQSIYGNQPRVRDESTPPEPETTYAQAKYAAEVMLQSLTSSLPHLHYCSVRLGTLAGGQQGLTPVDLMSRMAATACAGSAITLTNSKQEVQRLDVRDAADALVQLIRQNKKAPRLINLGATGMTTLGEIATAIVDAAAIATGQDAVELNDQQLALVPFYPMDSNLFTSTFAWQPACRLTDTVQTHIDYHLHHTRIHTHG